MKCLIIYGSPAKRYRWLGKNINSFTGQLVTEVRTEMERQGTVAFEEIYLADLGLPYCKGCYQCFDKGEGYCPHATHYQLVMNKIKEADCLIITSPVIALNVSALVKGFFDLGSYNHHRPSFFKKKALVVSSTAGGYAKKVCAYMRDELLHWGFNRVYTLSAIRMGAPEPTAGMIKSCQRAAKRLYVDTASGILYRPSFKHVFYFQLWRVMSGNNPASADNAYWRDSGLVNRESAEGIRLGVVKSLFAKAIHGAFRMVMKK